MRGSVLLACIVIVAAILLDSCMHKAMDIRLTGKVPPPVVCTGISPTFVSDIQPIFKVSCAKSGCHDGDSMPLDFSVYSQIKPLLDDSAIYYFVIKDRKMPQDGPLPDTAFRLIQCWFANNCKEQ